MRRTRDAQQQAARDRMLKPVDAWWTVLVVDPIAIRIVPSLARRPLITPTVVTVCAHVLGIVSAVLFVREEVVLAGLVFEVRFIADCIDGKLARATGRSSTFGRLLDVFGDRVLVLVNVVALGWPAAPSAVLLFSAAYPLHFQLRDARDELFDGLGSAKLVERLRDGRWGGAMARRRLQPMPTSVDVEHLLLLGGPLAWAAGFDWIAPLLWLAAGYFALECARYGASLLRLASAIDRARDR